MTTQTVRHGAFPAVVELGHTLRSFVAAIAAGSRAASEWERLNRMTDAQLARQQLTREEIGRAVFNRHFA